MILLLRFQEGERRRFGANSGARGLRLRAA
jgi:hypothetical protein